MSEYLEKCPVCGKDEFPPFLIVKDNFLSKETFTICCCSFCGFRFVNPRPTKKEIGRYYQSDEYISHNAKGYNPTNIIYKIARFFAIRAKYSLISTATKGTRLLDIGCGTGEVLAYCRKKGFAVQGVEPSASTRNLAISQKKLDIKETIEEIGSGQFDCITMWHVLEHVHDLNQTLDQIISMLKPEGKLIIALPNSDSPDAKEYKEFWAAYDVPRHLHHFTSKTFQALVNNHGLTIDKILPQKLDAYYVSLLSEKYRSGKSNYLKSVCRGFCSNLAANSSGLEHSSLIFLLSAEKSNFKPSGQRNAQTNTKA